MSFNYEPPRYTHALSNGQAITVAGLNVDDLGYLVQRHGELLELVFDGMPDAAEIITRAPTLAADILACGAGERDAADKAARLPIGLQILLLAKVFELSMSEADMGEVLGAVVRMFKSRKNPDSPTSPAI